MIKKQPKKPKQPKCRVCKKPYTKKYPLQITDTIKCLIIYSNQQEEKKKKAERKQTRKQKKEFYDNDRPHQLKLTQAVFNKLRRLQEFKWFKDQGLEPECISCGKKRMDWACGHYKTVGAQGGLRFDKKNTYLQCNRYCNKGLSGNISGNKTTRGFTQGIIDRFGEKEAQNIFNHCEKDTSNNWECEELIKMRKEFNIQIRELSND